MSYTAEQLIDMGAKQQPSRSATYQELQEGITLRDNAINLAKGALYEAMGHGTDCESCKKKREAFYAATNLIRT